MGNTERLAYSISEFAEMLGISYAKARKLVLTGVIPSVNIGTSATHACHRIPAHVVNELLNIKAVQKANSKEESK